MKFKASVEQKLDDVVASFVMDLLHSVTVTHLMHFGTRSYAEHQALGAYYDEMGDLVDAFVEAYQGKKNIIKTYPTDFALPTVSSVEYLMALGQMVAHIRMQGQFPQDSELQNEVDNIANLIKSTLYKLRFLS